jgi:hypothetical protein
MKFKKAALFFSAIVSLTAQAQVSEVTITIPEKKIIIKVADAFSSKTTFSTNFDGSINIKNPKLSYDGRYLGISVFASGIDLHSEEGVCALVGKIYRGKRSITTFSAEGIELMQLRKGGTLLGVNVTQKGHPYAMLNQITCE